MLGSGTQELARGLTEITTLLGAELERIVLRVLDERGVVQLEGGSLDADGNVGFSVEGTEVCAEGLARGRGMRVAPVEDYAGSRAAFVVVTADEGTASDTALARVAELLAAMLGQWSHTEFETEDTTAHLLSLFEQIRAIHDLADELPDCESLSDIAELCLRSLLVALGGKRAFLIMRADSRDTRVHVFGLEGTSGRLTTEDSDFDPGAKGPVELALQQGQESYGVIDPDVAHDDEWLQFGTTTSLCVPVCFGSEERREILGSFLVLDRAGKGPAFGSPDAEIVQSVGVLVGLVVGTERQAHAQNQLAVAQQIQKTLLPETAPAWPGLRLAGANRSANQVGGDYFDYVETGWGGLLCLIADVSGHDMASGIAMAMGRSELRGAAQRQMSPGTLLESVASSMFDDLSRSELFLTVFSLSFEDSFEDGSWRALWSNAGHNPGIVLRKNGDIEWLDDGGPMIGFMPNLDYDDVELHLLPGDMVLLYTDGVTEAPGRDGELLEEEGLLEILAGLRGRSAPEVLNGILRAVDERSGDHSKHDDVTVLVAEVLETGGANERGSGS